MEATALNNCVIIRPAKTDDAKLLTDLARRTFHQAYVSKTTQTDMETYLEIYFQESIQRSRIEDSASLVFLAFDSGRPIGYSILHPSRPPACVPGRNPIQMERLYLLQYWQGCGISDSLMETSLRAASRRDHDTVWLNCWVINLRALSFYRRWGFEEVGKMDFQFGNEVQQDLILRKQLD